MHRLTNINTIDCQVLNFKPFDLEAQIWRELNLFLDLRYLKKMLKQSFKSHTLSENRLNEKATNIQFCLRQAKDYINSAKYSSIITKPVLIYYSLVSLSTALIIFKKLDKTLHSMPESHGLSISYPDRINDNTKSQFLKVGAKINTRGLFFELANLNLCDTYSMPLKYEKDSNANKTYLQSFELLDINTGFSEVDLKTLFSNLTEIWKECRLTLNIESNIFEGQPILYNNQLILRLLSQNGMIPRNEIENKLSVLSEFELYESTNDNYFYKKNSSSNEILMPLIKTDKYGEVYITADKDNNIIANDYILQYLTFFILGSVARYKPDTWRNILEDNIQGFGKVPDILCDAAFIQIPLVVLKEFTNKHINIKK